MHGLGFREGCAKMARIKKKRAARATKASPESFGGFYWVLEKGFNSSYHNRETISFTKIPVMATLKKNTKQEPSLMRKGCRSPEVLVPIVGVAAHLKACAGSAQLSEHGLMGTLGFTV